MAFTHSTREASKALRISDRTLLRLRRDGVLRAGDHFRAAGAGLQRPSLLWDVREVERALARRSRRVLNTRASAPRPCQEAEASAVEPQEEQLFSFLE